MKIMKCDICGVEMDSWADVRIAYNFIKPRMRHAIDIEAQYLESMEICEECFDKIMKMGNRERMDRIVVE